MDNYGSVVAPEFLPGVEKLSGDIGSNSLLCNLEKPLDSLNGK